jgi:hypothetical protein
VRINFTKNANHWLARLSHAKPSPEKKVSKINSSLNNLTVRTANVSNFNRIELERSFDIERDNRQNQARVYANTSPIR